MAEKLGFAFIDLDKTIESEAGKSISAIFNEQGEQQFRQLEQTQLLALKEHTDTVIATGGGAPCFFENMKFMNDNGTTVYLRTPASLLVKRLSKELDSRPLLANKEPKDLKQFFENQLKERRSYYEQAKLIYFQEEDGQSIEDELIDRLNLLKEAEKLNVKS